MNNKYRLPLFGGILIVALFGLFIIGCNNNPKPETRYPSAEAERLRPEDLPKDLLQARETYLKAFSAYTDLATAGGEGDITSLLKEYRQAHEAYLDILEQYGYDQMDLMGLDEGSTYEGISGIEDIDVPAPISTSRSTTPSTVYFDGAAWDNYLDAMDGTYEHIFDTIFSQTITEGTELLNVEDQLTIRFDQPIGTTQKVLIRKLVEHSNQITYDIELSKTPDIGADVQFKLKSGLNEVEMNYSAETREKYVFEDLPFTYDSKTGILTARAEHFSNKRIDLTSWKSEKKFFADKPYTWTRFKKDWMNDLALAKLYLLHEVPLWVKIGNLKKAEFYYFEAIMALDRIQSVSGGLSSQSLPSEDGCFVTNDLISYYPNPDVRSNKKALHLTLFRDKLNEFLLGLDSDNIAIEKMYEIYGKVERFDSPYAQVSHYLGHFAPWGMDIMIALANKSLPIAKGQIFDVRVIPFYQQFTKKASPPYTRLQLEKGLPGKYDKVPEVYSKDLQIVQRLRSDLTFYSPSVNDWGWTFQAWMKYFNTELILAETIWASYKTGMPIALIIGEAIGWCSGPTGWVIGSGAIAAWTLYNNLYGGSGSEGISVSRDFKTGKERIIQTDDFPAYTYATLDESVKFVGSVSMLGAYQQKMLTPTNAAETALTLAILYSKYVDETDDASEGQVLNAKGYESDLGYWKADRGVVGIMAEDYTEYFYVPPVILSIQLDGRFKYDKIANSYDGYVYPNGFIDRKYYALDNSNKRNEFGGSVSNNSWRHRPKYPKNGPQKEKLKALFSKAEEMNWKLMTIENAPAEQQVRITIPKVQIAEWARYNEYFENDFMNKLDLKFFHGKRSDFSDNLQDKTTFEGFKKFKSYLVDETDEELVFGMRILSQSEVYNRVSSSDWDVDIDEELIDPDFARMTVKNYRRAMNHYTMTLSVPDPKDSKKRKLVTSIPLSFDRVGNSRRTDLEMNCTEEEGTIQYCCDRLEVQLDYEKNDIAAIISGYTLKKPKGPFDPPGANPGVTVTCTYTIQGASKKTDTSTSGADGLYSFSIPCKAKTATVIGLGDTINVDLGNCRQGIRVDLGGLKITQVSTIDPDLPPPPDINQD